MSLIDKWQTKMGMTSLCYGIEFYGVIKSAVKIE